MSLKVYYLDDEEELCINFSDYFHSENVAVRTFSDAKIAIEEVKKNPPDLIFIDYRMPGIVGDEVAAILDAKIPKILITGDIAVKAQYRFDNILTKPWDASVIRELLSFYLKKKEMGGLL